MSPTHTPGPWTWEYHKPLLAADGSNVNGVNRSKAELHANRALIAAAPDLLAACRIALEVIRRHKLDQYCGEDELTDPDGVNGIGDVLRQAIAKAEETPFDNNPTLA